MVAKLIVQNGTLKVGDAIVCGSAYGRVKAMYDTLQAAACTYAEAGPSMPVNVTGLDVAPAAGEHFYVLDDIATARQIAEEREGKVRRASLGGAPVHVTLENLFDRLGQEEVQTLNMILRADVRGSIEAIQKELTKLEHPGSEDQGAAGHGRRHHRGRRAPGRRFGRDHHRLQRRARRKRPRAGRAARRAGSPLRHHLQGDRRPEGRLGRHAQARAARSRTGPGPGAADVHDQPRRHDRRLPRAVRHDPAQLPACG